MNDEKAADAWLILYGTTNEVVRGEAYLSMHMRGLKAAYFAGLRAEREWWIDRFRLFMEQMEIWDGSMNIRDFSALAEMDQRSKEGGKDE